MFWVSCLNFLPKITTCVFSLLISIPQFWQYFDNIFILGEVLFKSIIKLYKKNTNTSKEAFLRLKTLSTLRFNYYPKQKKPVEISKQDGVALGCETHVDSGIFTILYQDKKGGLQVQNRKTKKWHNVPFNKNALVVNTGRALEFLSKGKFKATNHRVLWNKKKECLFLSFSNLLTTLK